MNKIIKKQISWRIRGGHFFRIVQKACWPRRDCSVSRTRQYLSRSSVTPSYVRRKNRSLR